MSRSSLLPLAPSFPPPHYAGPPGNCRVGDWEYPAFVTEWWGRPDPQEYQPDAVDPYNPATYDRSRPVWRFERCQHPNLPYNHGPCEVWRRTE